jgi:hypothetical protein
LFTVDRAIETLMRFLDRDEGSPLVVAPKTLHGSWGGLPTIPVTGFSRGFDWDSGKIFVATAVPIQAIGEEFEKERQGARDVSERLGWIYITINSNIPDAAKLKGIREILRRRNANAE